MNDLKEQVHALWIGEQVVGYTAGGVISAPAVVKEGLLRRIELAEGQLLPTPEQIETAAEGLALRRSEEYTPGVAVRGSKGGATNV